MVDPLDPSRTGISRHSASDLLSPALFLTTLPDPSGEVFHR